MYLLKKAPPKIENYCGFNLPSACTHVPSINCRLDHWFIAVINFHVYNSLFPNYYFFFISLTKELVYIPVR